MSTTTLLFRWGALPEQRFAFESLDAALDALWAMASLGGAAVDSSDGWREDRRRRLEAGEVIPFNGFTAEIDTALGVTEEQEAVDGLICYQLVRSDVPSYVVGKALAQANHCGTAMVIRALKRDDRTNLDLLLEWAEEADGFGTCITLEVTLPVARQIVSLANLSGLYSEMINDPTYPIRDGDTIKTLPVDTCAFVFGRQSRAKAVVRGLNLFP
jgi:hypothetical protein